jgi:nucleoside-triphosphatase THEP1
VVYILTGVIQSGKTTLLKQLVRLLKQKGINVRGHLSEAVHQNNEKIGYDLLDIKDGTFFPFLRMEGDEDWERIGHYFFMPLSLKKAEAILLGDPDAEVFIVDEIGPLELKGKGLWPALMEKLAQSSAKILIVVRKNILHDMIESIQKENQKVRVFDIQDKNVLKAMVDTFIHE